MKPRVNGSPLLVLCVALALSAVLVAACAGRHGSARLDARVGDAFDAAQLLPGHRYYTTGSETNPDALLALREERPLRSEVWREVAMTPALLAKLTGNMRENRVYEGPTGHLLFDDRGEPIGAWYSWLQPPPVALLDDGGVVITPPFKTRMDPGPAPGMSR